MLNRQQKTNLVSELEERFQRQHISIFTNIRGISVIKLMHLRRELKKIGAELKVAKKTLLARALTSVGSEVDAKALDGEIGVIFGYEDQVLPLKAAAKFAKENQTFQMLKGIVGGKIMAAADILALSKLPSREQLYAQFAYALNATLRGLVTVLQGNIRNLVVVLSQVKDKK